MWILHFFEPVNSFLNKVFKNVVIIQKQHIILKLIMLSHSNYYTFHEVMTFLTFVIYSGFQSLVD